MNARRPAAVVVGIMREPERGVIFLQRAAGLRDHPGQVGLPGGGAEAADPSLWHTALRELWEEVGIRSERVTHVGELPIIEQRINTFDVAPFVAVIEPGALTIDMGETAAVFTVPLEKILSPALHEGMVEFGALRIASPILDHAPYRIWGLTANILQSFVLAWNGESGMRERAEALLGDFD